jgi:hypothetical protein
VMPTPTTVIKSNSCSSATLDVTGSVQTIQWMKQEGEGWVDLAGATTRLFTTTVSGVYRARVTSSTCTVVSNAVTLALTPVLTADKAEDFCTGGGIVLRANTSNIAGLVYQWMKDGSPVGEAENTGVFTARQNGAYSVKLVGTTCSGESSRVAVALNTFPAIVIDAKKVCEGAKVALTATPSGGVWSGINVTNGQFDAAGLSAGTYKVTYTYTNAEGCSKSVDDVVTVTESPKAVISYVPAAPCKPATMSVTASADYRYQWFLDGNRVRGATSSSYTTSTSGTYTVTVTNGSGCVTTSEAVTVNTGIPVLTVYAPSSLTVCYPATVYFTVVSNDPNVRYQWKRNGVNIAGATGTSYTAKSSGNYTVAVTSNSFGCTSTAIAGKVTIMTGCPNDPCGNMSTLSASKTLSAAASPIVEPCDDVMSATRSGMAATGEYSVSPNPAKSDLTITAPVNEGSASTLKLYSQVDGVVTNVVIPSGKQSVTIDVSRFPEGVYYLQITGPNGTTQQRVVISHDGN